MSRPSPPTVRSMADGAHGHGRRCSGHAPVASCLFSATRGHAAPRAVSHAAFSPRISLAAVSPPAGASSWSIAFTAQMTGFTARTLECWPSRRMTLMMSGADATPSGRPTIGWPYWRDAGRCHWRYEYVDARRSAELGIAGASQAADFPRRQRWSKAWTCRHLHALFVIFVIDHAY